MQWETLVNHEESRTVSNLLETGEITVNYGRCILLYGRKSAQMQSFLPSEELPMLAQLSCSVERLTEALTALRSWMEKNESESGRIPVKSVKKHSPGYMKCLQVTEWGLIVGYLGMAVEESYLSD